MRSDRLRQATNVVLAFAQPATAVLAFGMGTTFEEAADACGEKTLIEPAGYAFVIWSIIYLGTLAYAVFQALPSQRETPLFRHIGWFTASSFLSVVVWLVAARFGLIWVTVGCIVWMLASLAYPFRVFVRLGSRLTIPQYILVVWPFSIFLGWVSVATFANTAAALKMAEVLDVGLAEEGWTVLMIGAAGLIGSVVTFWSGGNVGYGLTLIWAFVGILAADQMRLPHTTITPAAATMAVLVAAVLVAARIVGGQPRRSRMAAEPGAAADGGGM